MTWRGIGCRSAPALIITLALSVVAACGSGHSDGPLQNISTAGQPNFSAASIYTSPIQTADMTAYLVNTSHDSITLISASLMPIAGYSPGRLIHVGVQAGLGGVAAARGWPVPGVSVRPLPGARLAYGRSNIIFGFEGTRIGRDYVTAGLRITYRYHGQIYTVQAWSAAVDCVVANPRYANYATCNQAYEIAQKATEKQAGA